jgi:hypothetical protein
MKSVRIEPLQLEPPIVDGLSALLRDAATSGASIGLLDDLTIDESKDSWNKVIAEFKAGLRMIWVARDPADGSVVGSLQLGFERRRKGRSISFSSTQARVRAEHANSTRPWAKPTPAEFPTTRWIRTECRQRTQSTTRIWRRLSRQVPKSDRGLAEPTRVRLNSAKNSVSDQIVDTVGSGENLNRF